MRLLASLVFGYWIWRQWWLGSYRPDFEILIRAAQRLSVGEAVYQISDHAEHTKAPGLTWLMQGFLVVPGWLGKAIWDAASWGSLLWLGRLSQVGWSTGVLGWLLVAGPWWAEMRMGQYNLLLAALSLGVPIWESRRPSTLRSVILGGVCLLVLLLKPTQLILIPFMLSAVLAQGRWRATLLGGVVFGLILSLGYSLQWGWQGWISAHREWFAFLPLSEAKHILRSDNFGLTTQLVRGLGEWVPAPLISKLMLGCGLAAALVGLRRSRPLSQGLFVDALFLSIVCSPMAWRQNFSPLFLMLSWAVLGSRGLSRARMGVFWCCSVAFGVLASDILGPSGAELFGRWGGPLWLAIIAWWSARPALRPDPQLCATF